MMMGILRLTRSEHSELVEEWILADILLEGSCSMIVTRRNLEGSTRLLDLDKSPMRTKMWMKTTIRMSLRGPDCFIES